MKTRTYSNPSTYPNSGFVKLNWKIGAIMFMFLAVAAPAAGQVWSTPTGWQSFSVAYSSDGMRLASASEDNTIRLWDAATGTEIRQFEGHTDWVNSVAFSPDGMRLASASIDNTVRLWDAATGTEVRQFGGHTDWVNSVTFSPDGMRLASGSDNDFDDSPLRLWDVATGNEIRRFEGHTGSVRSAAFSPDGMRLASASDDNTVRLWDVGTGNEIHRYEGHSGSIRSVAFSLDGMRLASASDDSTLVLWDAATGNEIRRFEGHADRVNSVAFSPDGMRLASASDDNTVRLWDLATGTEIRRFEGHKSDVNSVAYSPDGMRLASASSDRSIKLWALSVSLIDEVSDLTFTQGSSVSGLVLPDGIGGTAPYVFTLQPAMPAGLTFDGSTRTISGSPTEVTAPAIYTYAVTDQTGNSVSQTFTIEVVAGAEGRFVNLQYDQGSAVGAGGGNNLFVGLPPDARMATRFVIDASSGVNRKEWNGTISGNGREVRIEGISRADQVARIEAPLSSDQKARVEELLVSRREGVIKAIRQEDWNRLIESIGRENWESRIGELFEDERQQKRIRELLRDVWEDLIEVSTGVEVEGSINALSTGDREIRISAHPRDTRDRGFPSSSVADQQGRFWTDSADSLEARIDRIWLAPYFLNQFANATLPTDAPRDLTVYIYSDRDGVPGDILFSKVIEDPRPYANVTNFTLNFFELDLSNEGIGALPDTVHIAFGNAGTDDNLLVTGPAPYTEKNVSHLYTQGAWMQFWDLTTQGGNSFNETVVPIRARFRLQTAFQFAETVEDQSFMLGRSITPLVLPEATGGVLPISNSLTPALPTGLVFDGLMRTISGTPWEVISPKIYNYTVTDQSGDSKSLTFSIEVTAGGVEYVDIQYDQGEAVGAGGGNNLFVGLEADTRMATRFVVSASSGGKREDWNRIISENNGEVRIEAISLDHRQVQIVPSAGEDRQSGIGFYAGEDSPKRMKVSSANDMEVRIDRIWLAPYYDNQFGNTTLPDTAPRDITVYIYSDREGVPGDVLFSKVIEDPREYAGVRDFTLDFFELDLSNEDIGILPDTVHIAYGNAGTDDNLLVSGPAPYADKNVSHVYRDGGWRRFWDLITTDGDSFNETVVPIRARFRLQAPLQFTQTITDQSFPNSQPITPLELPAAIGGVSPISYSLMPKLPTGLTYDGLTRAISGTPTEVTPVPIAVTYAATDALGDMVSMQFSIEVYSTVDIQSELFPSSFALYGNYPNPFSSSTRIVFDLPSAAEVSVDVLDITGRRIRRVPARLIEAGWQHGIDLSGVGLPSGMYLYRMHVALPEGHTVESGSFIRIR